MCDRIYNYTARCRKMWQVAIFIRNDRSPSNDRLFYSQNAYLNLHLRPLAASEFDCGGRVVRRIPETPHLVSTHYPDPPFHIIVLLPRE